MNFNLSQVPQRTSKPRAHGLTMVMDKGLSLREAEDMISVSESYLDIVKLGFGTAYVTPNIEKKISLYQSAGAAVYFGGTLFEAFIIRNQVDDYIKLIEKYKLKHMEISDGSIT
ncbi:MAG: phosphosulfolactate synthase, partial [Bacteroidia bacterium]|nr:phosphosulfolactate synthase [Bacteroidia bacterium]